MSASETAAAFAPAEDSESQPAVGTEALAQSLLLVRASALGVVRLQLAMERRDRPVALETVDELMQLDRKIGELVGSLPGASGTVAATARALETQRRAVVVEKFSLAAGTFGPRIAEGAGRWIDQAPARVEAAHHAPALESEPDEARGISPQLAVALAFLAVLAAAAAIFLFFSETGRALVASPIAYEGARR